MGNSLSFCFHARASELRHQVELGGCEHVIDAVRETPFLLNSSVFPGQNTLPHVIARYGQTSMLTALLCLRDELAFKPSSNGLTLAGAHRDSTTACSQSPKANSYIPYRVPDLAELVNVLNARKQSPLIIAASRGHADLVHILIQAGADVLLADKQEGCTALHYAALYGHVECVRLLLVAADCQPDQPTASLLRNAESLPATLAASTDIMLRHESLPVPASEQHHDAIGANHTSRWCGGFVDAASYAGATALHLACDAGAADVVKLLCRYGADVNAIMKPTRFRWLAIHHGARPLHLAAEQGHLAVVLAILNHKHDHPEISDPRDTLDAAGLKPHQLAFLSHHFRIALILRPGYPLRWLFDTTSTMTSSSDKQGRVSKLAVLAARALKQQLCTAIDELEESAMIQRFHAMTDTVGVPGEVDSVSNTRKALLAPLQQQPQQQQQASSQHSSPCSNHSQHQQVCQHQQPVSTLVPTTRIQVEGSEEAIGCPVCWEEAVWQSVACLPCKHELCLKCARRVCTAIKTKPANCPMCRANIYGFVVPDHTAS